ncbi:MAG TPA: TetR/AcrR family transcriptional regulator [Acidimicrobiales bacterium]|nr:TetR/AcrR family transcriptional regulator [Acidimicrobiales bacterium]
MAEVAGSPDRREVIRDAAAELFAAKGVAATTVREIADAVGILSGSLYHHFKSKQDIVEEILAGYFDDLRSGYASVLSEPRSPAEQLRSLIGSSLETVSRHVHAAEIYQGDYGYLQTLPHFGDLKSVAGDIQKAWLDVINAGVASGDFRHDVDPSIFYRLIRDSVWLSVRWYRARADYPAAQFADDTASVFLQGFANRRPPGWPVVQSSGATGLPDHRPSSTPSMP